MYWVYELPTWLFGALTVLVFCAFGLGGVVATRKWAPSLHHEEASHNDIVGFYFGAITVFYGITLGLLMVGVWSTFSETEDKVDREAGCIAALYRDISNYPDPARGQLQDDLRSYTRNVIEIAWPQQQKGLISTKNLATLDSFEKNLASFEPRTEAQKTIHAESYRQFNELVQRRRSRLLMAKAGLSSSLWTLVLAGALINIAVTWCFHLKNYKMHLWMTALISSLLGLMIFLLAAMDHPFMGKVAVSSEPYQVVYEQLMNPSAAVDGTAAKADSK
jgi:hypothetical protein